MVDLRFYATGSFLAVTAVVHCISRPNVSSVIKDATDCLVILSPQFIKIPTQQESAHVMQDFNDIAFFFVSDM